MFRPPQTEVISSTILRLIGHDRTAAAGQQDICHIIYRYIIRDIVYQSAPSPGHFPDILS